MKDQPRRFLVLAILCSQKEPRRFGHRSKKVGAQSHQSDIFMMVSAAPFQTTAEACGDLLFFQSLQRQKRGLLFDTPERQCTIVTPCTGSYMGSAGNFMKIGFRRFQTEQIDILIHTESDLQCIVHSILRNPRQLRNTDPPETAAVTVTETPVFQLFKRTFGHLFNGQSACALQTLRVKCTDLLAKIVHTDRFKQMKKARFGTRSAQSILTIGTGNRFKHRRYLLRQNEYIRIFGNFRIFPTQTDVKTPFPLFLCRSEEEVVAVKMETAFYGCTDRCVEFSGKHTHPRFFI